MNVAVSGTPPASSPQASVWLNRNFLLLAQGGWISRIGTQIALVTTAYWIKRSTNSASLVGLLATTSAIPVLLLSPIAGAVADRSSKRNTLMFWEILGGIVSWSFVFLIGSGRFPLPQMLAGIFTGNLILAAGGAFATPASNAFLPELVQPGQLSGAIALIQASGFISVIVGQALAGFLLARFAPQTMYGLDGVSYFVSAAALFLIHASPAAGIRKRSGLLRNAGGEIKAGLKYLWQYRGLRNLMLACLPITLFTSPVLVFLPFYTTNTLHEPLSRYGYLLAMISIGVLAGLALAGRLKPNFPYVHKLLFFCVAGNALLTFALSATQSLGPAMAILFVNGLISGAILILSLNSAMLRTEPGMRGRVSSFFVMIAQGVTPLAMAAIGMLGDVLRGNIQLLYAGLSILLLLTAFGLYVNRDLRRFFDVSEPVPQ